MIDEVLNRDNIELLAQQLLRSPQARAAQADPDLALALEYLAQAVPLDEEYSVQDRQAYIPNNPALAILQSFAEQWARTQQEGSGERIQGDDALPAWSVLKLPEDRRYGPLATEEIEHCDDAKEGWGERMGLDPLFLTEGIKALARRFRERLSFRLPADPPRTFRMADDARVVLVGDWGNGGPQALAVADQIKQSLADAGDREAHVIHLGDVYYAGTADEAREYFLELWPIQVASENRFSWCLNGNHDMYSGGEGMFQEILPDTRFCFQRTVKDELTTQFHLRSKYWQILGLDTAWEWHTKDPRGEFGSIDQRQAEWLTGLAQNPDVGTILLSHHHPFSRRAEGLSLEHAGNLLEQTLHARQTTGIEAWFWGHNHYCVTYNEPDHIGGGLKYGACIGHGSIPIPPEPHASGDKEWEFVGTQILEWGRQWRLCGFAVVDFRGQIEPTVNYIDQNGANCKASDILRMCPPL